MIMTILGLGLLLQMLTGAFIAYCVETNNWETWNVCLLSSPIPLGQIVVIVYVLILVLFLLHIVLNRSLGLFTRLFWFFLVLAMPIFGAFGYWKQLVTGQNPVAVPVKYSDIRD